MSAPDFKKLLSLPANTIEKPKPVPQGLYRAMLDGFQATKVGQKQTSAVNQGFRLLAIHADVEPEDIEAYGGEAKLLGRKMSNNFFLTEDSMWRLTEFLKEKVGQDTDDGRSIGEHLQEAQNREVIIEVKHRIDDRTGDPIANIDGFLNVNEA